MSRFFSSLPLLYVAYITARDALEPIDNVRIQYLHKEPEEKAELHREIYALRAAVRSLVEDVERAERAARHRRQLPPPVTDV